jgi:hypothetical protein
MKNIIRQVKNNPKYYEIKFVLPTTN